MAFNNPAGPPSYPGSYGSSRASGRDSNEGPIPIAGQFDIVEWYAHFQSCHRFFLDHAQHSPEVQALAAFTNIILPCHRHPNPVFSYSISPQTAPRARAVPSSSRPPLASTNIIGPSAQSASVVPYIRRLVATGFDTDQVLQGFFGNNWLQGVGRLHEIERRNYLFAAKSADWLAVKASYEPSPNETIPYLSPLQRVEEKEIATAETEWSNWLAMADWMIGPRAPPEPRPSPRIAQQQIKREPME